MLESWLGWVALAVLAVVAVLGWLTYRRHRPRRPPRLMWWAIASVVLAGAAYAFLVHASGGPAAVGAVIRGLDPLVLLAALGLEAASQACLAQVYRTTYLASGGQLSYSGALAISLGAFSLTQLLPGGGVLAGAFAVRRLTRRHGADPVTAATTVVLYGLVAMGTLGLLVSAGATIAALGSHQYTRYAAVSAIVPALVWVGLRLLRTAVERPSVRARMARVLARITFDRVMPLERWDESLQDQVAVWSQPSALVRPAVWSAMKWLLDLAALTLLVDATGATVPFLGVVLAYGVANLLNGLPVTPGGIGLVEAGIAGTLVAFGVAPAPASVAAISYRMIAHWLPVLLAAPVIAGFSPATVEDGR